MKFFPRVWRRLSIAEQVALDLENATRERLEAIAAAEDWAARVEVLKKREARLRAELNKLTQEKP